MTWSRIFELRRAMLGAAVALWVILLAFAVGRAGITGTQWGLSLSEDAAGRVVAAEVTLSGTAGPRVYPGFEIVDLDGTDPHQFLGASLSSVHEVSFRDANGTLTTLRADEIPPLSLALLTIGGLLFVLLGALVHRWSADPLLGRLFLLLSCSFATALVCVPAASLGYLWASLLAAAASFLGPASLVGIFMVFPHPLRRARRVVFGALAIAAVLTTAQVAVQLLNIRSNELDLLSRVSLLVSLAAGLALLARRASNASDRRALMPLLLGLAVGVLPVGLFFALNSPSKSPQLFQLVLGTTAAIPLSFAYSILRHQVFGLDALMRRVLLRCSNVAIGVGLFFALWWAAGLLLDLTEAALVAAALTTLAAPSVSARADALLNRWLYPPFHRLLHAHERFDADNPHALGAALAVRLRELVTVSWAACLVIEDNDADWLSGHARVLGSDGLLPAWLGGSVAGRQLLAQAAITPIRRAGRLVGLLAAGPRLDGSELSRLERQTMEVLAGNVAALLDAALLRERAEDEVRFRQGVTRLTHDLAAAATVLDVLRSTAEHAASLLKADSAGIWRCDPDGPVGLIGETDVDGAANMLHELIDPTRVGLRDEWTELTADGRALVFGLGVDGAAPDVCLAFRAVDAPRFGAREDRRAREIAEHVNVAVRRAAEREHLEDQLRHQAFYDSLTSLPNRALFVDRVEHAVARSERLGDEVAVLFVDLDRFKVINDSLGHAAGDELLMKVATRLRESLRSSDTIARLGGDEFTVLLEGPNAKEQAVKAAKRILATLQAPFVLDGHDAYISASIGIAGTSHAAAPGRDLMREADIAMYRAKGAGRAQFAIYEERMSRLPTAHLHLESDLHRALERGELRVHYQPIFALSDGHITAMEALVRWEHPVKGLVSPADFIPLAEDTGLIVPIGAWVLGEACARMREWQQQFPHVPPLNVSVNLSARQFQDPELIEHVQEALTRAQLDPDHLQLEITESAVMHDAEATISKLHELKALGIRLAMDDFGTGYSSLAYLKRFPIDVLKIDRSFVSGLIDGRHDLAIVQNVIGLAKALGLTTTAEGIEERSQWMILKQLGCENGQGFIFSRPLATADVPALLEEEGTPPVEFLLRAA